MPLRTSASEERRSVSCITSAPKRSPHRPTAVRQTPLTATESPSDSSRASGDSMARRTPSLVECDLGDRPEVGDEAREQPPTTPAGAPRAARRRRPCSQSRVSARSASEMRVDALALERVARRAPAEQQRGDEQAQLVDLAAVEEGARQVRAALEQHRGDRRVERAELVERRAHAGGLVLAGGDDDLGAGVLERVGVRAPRGARDDDDERHLVGGRDELRVQRQARGGVEDHAPRLVADAVDARGELRVVGQRGADAHGHGVARGAPAVGDERGCPRWRSTSSRRSWSPPCRRGSWPT